jgi:plastocyanin
MTWRWLTCSSAVTEKWDAPIRSRKPVPPETARRGAGFRRWSASAPERMAAILFLAAAVCSAGTLRGHFDIVSSQDAEVRKHSDYSGIVVWLEPLGATPAAAPHKKAEMIQKGKRFIPHILAIEVGTTVDLPNHDPIFHNAFSNYDGQIFDVGLYPPGTSQAVTFHREGIVRIFCNIHPAMSAVVVVVKSPYFSTSTKSGEFTISNVPSGRYRMHVFHERATQQTLDALARNVEVASDLDVGKISVSESGYLILPHKNKYGKDYPPADGGTYPGVKP